MFDLQRPGKLMLSFWLLGLKKCSSLQIYQGF